MIDLDRVSKSYEKGQPAVDEISLHVDKGEFVFVVGESGSGKSTLIRLLLKELEPTKGIITVNGHVLNTMKHKAVSKYRREVGVVFQDFRLLNDRNVYENVAFAQHVIEEPGRIVKRRVPEVLRMVGLAEKYKSKPMQLSGGEQQRVAVARAIVNRPKILLADEPTGNLDPRNSYDIMKLLDEINQQGTTVLVVTHNKDLVDQFHKRVITQGFKNIWRNRMFSVASITTMTACILLFGMFFSVLMNVNFMIRTLEEEVGVTVLFDEGLEQDKIDEIGEKIRAREHVTDVTYTSAEEAWEKFQQEYFEGNEEYAKSFSENGENPLANSASYTVRVDEIENQTSIVTRIKRLEGVRQVNQSAGATKTLISFNSLFTYVAVAIIALLLVVSIFLIANTVNVGISVRRHEIAIMKLIGATDSFVRAPFIVEGLLLGLIGSLIPLGILFVAYDRILGWLLNRFGVLNTISGSLPSVLEVFHVLAPVGVALGLGIGLIGSIITVRRHLRV